MNTKTRNQTYRASIDTPKGRFIATYSAKGLCSLSFPQPRPRASAAGIDAEMPPQAQKWHRQTARALGDALAGRTARVLPPLDLSSGTLFQQAVWKQMLRLKSGETASYFELAQAVGKPRGARAVGGACGANPIPVLVPCHRVLGAGGRLGGFSGGLDWKRALLSCEHTQWAES